MPSFLPKHCMMRKVERLGVEKSPTFQFWDTVLRMEIMGLIFIRAHREANFPLYVESLCSLVPWFFALDHHNYARWAPVHIRDMESLTPSILEEFQVHGHCMGCSENPQSLLSYAYRPGS